MARSVTFLVACVLALIAEPVSAQKYLVMSVPKAYPGPRIVYAQLPDVTTRVLIPETAGLISPGPIALDEANARLFVADGPMLTVYWYQLIKLPDGKLNTDGRRHVCLTDFVATWLAVDSTGNLFLSGKAIVPPVTAMNKPTDVGLFMWPVIAIVTGATKMVVHEGLWNKGNSGGQVLSYDPSGIAVDGGTIFFGNAKAGTAHGSLIKAPVSPPDMNPSGSISSMADNEDSVTGVCVALRYIFYATPNGIYGVPKTKSGASCANDGCKLITDVPKNPKGMTWDGDGTIFIAADDGVYTIPSANNEPHRPVLVIKTGAPVVNVDLLQLTSAAGERLKGMLSAALVLMVMVTGLSSAPQR